MRLLHAGIQDLLSPLKHEDVIMMQSNVAREAQDVQKARTEVTRMLGKLSS
jgi:hypothetical protein